MDTLLRTRTEILPDNTVVRVTTENIFGLLEKAAKDADYMTYCDYLLWAENNELPYESIDEAYAKGSSQAKYPLYFNSRGGVKEEDSWTLPEGYLRLTIGETLRGLGILADASKTNSIQRYRQHLAIARLRGITMDQIKDAYNYGRTGLGGTTFYYNGQRKR